MLSTSRLLTAGLFLAALGSPAAAQRCGWHYSPYPGEGDRAALGCSYGADATHFSCIAVRCEDDRSVGLYLHTSRAGGDAGRWQLEIDASGFDVMAAAGTGSPYGARVEGDVAPILTALRDGSVLFLDPETGAPIDRAISLSGSLSAINQALFFCAPPDAPTGTGEGAQQ